MEARPQDSQDSFADYQWRFVDGRPIQNAWRNLGDIPASTPITDALSRDLKQRGFRFVGSTICYAHMQAVGMVNDHIVDCFCWRELRGEQARLFCVGFGVDNGGGWVY